MAGEVGKVSRRNAADAAAAGTQGERADMMREAPVEVVSFDPATQTATLKMLISPTVGGKKITPPLLHKVPFEQARGGGFGMTVPVKAGDKGRVTFADRDSSAYEKGGEQSQSASRRMNSLSDGTFTLGKSPGTGAYKDYDSANMFIGSDDHKHGLRVSPGGTIAIEGNGESLLLILSELCGLLMTDKLDIKVGSSQGKLHAMEHRFAYARLQGRIDAMKLR